jgi:DNA-binding XRE family transcriptional regulator
MSLAAMNGTTAEAALTVCPVCNKKFAQHGHGVPRKQCSRKCTIRAAHLRRKAKLRALRPEPLVVLPPVEAPPTPAPAPAARRRRGGRVRGSWDVAPAAFKAWRQGQSISRARFAKLLGVSSTSVQNWETGNAVPSPQFQAAIARFMKDGVGTQGGSVGAPGLEAATRDLGAAIGRFLVALTGGGR